MARMGVGRCCCGNYLYSSSSFIRWNKLIGTTERESTQADILFPGQYGTNRIGIDYKNQILFIVRGNQPVYSTNPELKNVTLVFTEASAPTVFLQCVDHINQRFYFTGAIGGIFGIIRVNYDGTGRTVLFTLPTDSGYQPWLIPRVQCDPAEDKLFWIQNRPFTVGSGLPPESYIYSSDLDGAGASLIVTAPTDTRISDLQSDPANMRLWYIQDPLGYSEGDSASEPWRLWYCDYDGTDQTTWDTAPSTPFVTDYGYINIMVSQKDGRIYWGQTGNDGVTWTDAGNVLYSDTFAKDDRKIITRVGAGADGVSIGEFLELGKGFETFG